MKIVAFIIYTVLFSSILFENIHAQTKTAAPFSTNNKKITVYTTAESSPYKLSKVSEVELKMKWSYL
jgi:hypothetical protein